MFRVKSIKYHLLQLADPIAKKTTNSGIFFEASMWRHWRAVHTGNAVGDRRPALASGGDRRGGAPMHVRYLICMTQMTICRSTALLSGAANVRRSTVDCNRRQGI